MNNLIKMVKHDLKKYYEYRIFHIMLVLSFLFTAIISFFQDFNPSNFLYVSIFILPVVIFSISMHLEKQENSLLPLLYCPCKASSIIISKIISALILSSLPILFFSLAFGLILDLDISYTALILAYYLGVALHVVIGISLSIISKNDRFLSISYIVYIIVFSVVPIFYANGLIPMQFQYYLVISPAYLSGVLIDNILTGVPFSSIEWLIVCIALQIIYLVILLVFVVKPYFKAFLFSISDQYLNKEVNQ